MITALPKLVHRRFKPLLSRANQLSFSKYTEKNVSRLDSKTHDAYTSTNGSLLTSTRNELERHALNGSGDIRFGDWGSGWGGGVLEAETLNPRIQAFGVSLTPVADIRLAGKIFHGSFEELRMPGQFNVIQSRRALMHASNYAVALENMLNSLKSGGTLHLHFSDSIEGLHVDQTVVGKKTSEALTATLKKQGFTISHTPTRETVISKKGGKCDLRKFYTNKSLNKFPTARTTTKVR